MNEQTYKSKPSVVGPLIIGVVITLVLAYATISMNTGDLLWFWPRNDNLPTAIVVHCYSEDVMIEPESAHYTEITTIVNDALSGQKRWDPLSLSEVTYQEYLTHPKMMTLEVTFPRPVRIHTNTAFYSNVDMLLIPLDARHSSKDVVFGRTEAGHPAAGSLFIDSTAAVKEYLNTQEICVGEKTSMWDTNETGSEPQSEN
jgi:hypothetical protein